MFLEGVLIEAIDLINGVSIVQVDRVERVDYFHIELDTHDIIIAEGALSESFVDDDSRGIFQNAHEFAALYPNMPTERPTRYCAPRLAFGTQVEVARRLIAQRAGIPYTPSSNAKRPRALVVDSWVPQLGHDGGANAILDHIGALQAVGFEVSFLALRVDGSDANALSSLGVQPLSVPRSGRFSDFARAHAGQFDLVYLHRVETAMRCLRLARRYFDAQIIYSVADLHHLRLQAQSQLDADHASKLTQQAYQFARA
jgi:Hint domain